MIFDLTSMITAIATGQQSQVWLDFVIYTIGSGAMVLALNLNKQPPGDQDHTDSTQEPWRQLPPTQEADNSDQNHA